MSIAGWLFGLWAISCLAFAWQVVNAYDKPCELNRAFFTEAHMPRAAPPT